MSSSNGFDMSEAKVIAAAAAETNWKIVTPDWGDLISSIIVRDYLPIPKLQWCNRWSLGMDM